MRLLLIFCNFIIASTASAYDFSAADALFDRREEGAAAIDAARAAYIETLGNGLSPAELIYAIEQTARLDVYAALRIDRAQIKQRQPLLMRCLRDIEKIAPNTSAGANPHYYFWKTTCTSYWAEAEGALASLQRAKEAFALIEAGRRVDSAYEAAGFDRLLGGLNTRLPAFNPYGPGGSIPKALEHLEITLNAPAYSGAKYPETESGDYHFTSHYFYAEALRKAGRDQEARHVLDTAIQRIEDGDLPTGRIPETRLALQRLKELRDGHLGK